MSTEVERSQAAFERDLPDLLASHRGEWAAYAGERRIALMATQTALYHHCLEELGLAHDQFVVARIIPISNPYVELPTV